MRNAILRWAAVLGLVCAAGCAQPDWRSRLQSEDPLARIDGAIAAGQARDRAAVPLLIDRLEDDDEAVRMYAILALERIEGTTLGYEHWADETERAHMAQQWRRHVKQRRQERVTRLSGRSPQAEDPAMAGTPSTQPLAQEATRE